MAEISNIEWTDATWNPWHGCIKVSPGCKNCYMYRDKDRFGQEPTKVLRSKTTFDAPLKWKDPHKIFTCSWSDFFIEQADEWRNEAWDIISKTPQHTYQILTKRPERILGNAPNPIPPNCWIGVSVEDKQYGVPRISMLREVPAPVRFLSVEPLLEDIGNLDLDSIHWVIVGGESGPGARPMMAKWAISVKRQCYRQGVPFFMKQLSQANTNEYKNFSRFARELQVREMPA